MMLSFTKHAHLHNIITHVNLYIIYIGYIWRLLHTLYIEVDLNP